MSLVPALDLRSASNDSDPAMAHVPANVEAEQALLGALLYDNAAFERLGDHFGAHHFFEPFHQRLFAKIEAKIRAGQLAEPIILAEQLSSDEGFEQLGGVRYLADLVDRAPPAANAPDYARVVYDLALRRDLIRISGEIAHVAAVNEDDLPAREQIEQAEAQLFSLAETGGVTQGFRSAQDYLAGAVEMAGNAFQRDGGLSGLSTGLIDLDAKIGGLHPSDLVVIAARPSMGKSSLALNIAYDVARRYAWEPQPDGSRKTTAGGRVAFFSLEMSAEQLGLRLLADASGVSGDRLRKGQIDASEFGRVRDAAIEIQEIPLFVDATGAISMPKLAARARRMQRQGGVDLIIVDYLQLMISGARAENRVQEIGVITGGLKALAKDLGVPVVALAQLSRQVEQREDKKPQLSDLRDSGTIEQDADMVMFIYREAYYLSRTEPREGTEEHFKWAEEMDQVRNLADIIIGKQRHGPIGTVRLSFNEDLTKFGNAVRDPSRYASGYRSPAGPDA
jgi:replicative DNA helicase